MSTPILATKLYIPPPRTNIVPRPRLHKQLNQGLHRKLTLISAPAGFGKTTLVSEWVAASARPVAWLSLEEADGELVRFLTYLVSALQTIGALSALNLGEAVLAKLDSPLPLSTESLLTTLLNEIATIPDDFVLVLDDYHSLDSKPADGALTFLLDHLPPQMHLILTTREDPDIPLARLRVRDQLTELRAADLRFTPAEASEFLNQAMGLNLSAQDIAALETRTEGWIAGLQLASLALQGHPAAAADFIHSFSGSHHFVLDYLVQEVLQSQPEAIQTFLLRTSILDRLCGPLCDAVLDAPAGSGQTTLAYLEQSNLFIVPLDDERRWYRYHHLFGDLLRQRLASSSVSASDTDNSVNALHLRASRWYEQNGFPADAIRHALAAKDFDWAARLLELIWHTMDGNFQTATWLAWVQVLPDPVIRARPVLCVALAWAHLNARNMDAGEARLRDAERWLDPTETNDRAGALLRGMVVADEAQFQSLPASIASARAYIAQAQSDVPGGIKYAQRALDLLPVRDHLRRGQAAALLGLAHWSIGNFDASYQALSEAMANFQATGNIVFAISTTYGLADIRIAQGRLRDAMRTYEHSLQLVAAQGEPVLTGTADLYLGLAELHHEQGNSEAAAQNLLKSETLGESAGLPDWSYRFSRTRARIQETAGDLDGALDLLDDAERKYFKGPVPDLRPIAALKARVWLKQGKVSQSRIWARERGLSVTDDLTYLQEFEHITFARILLAQSNTDRAEHSIQETGRFLARLLHVAEQGGRTGSVIEILLLDALAHSAQRDIPMALASLKRALTLAEPESYVRIFIDQGVPMAELLSRAAAQSILPEYANKLLSAFPSAAPKNPPQGHLPPTSSPQPLIEPLSPRELEVLHLITQGLSNREISEKLFLALDTVKGHNRRIFGKLQVSSRNKAIARARELGLA